MTTRMLLSTAAIALLTVATAMAQSDSDRRKPDDASKAQTPDADRQRGPSAPLRSQARPQGGDQQKGAQAPQKPSPQATGQAPSSGDDKDKQRTQSSEPQRGQQGPAGADSKSSPQGAQNQSEPGRERGRSSGDSSKQGTPSTQRSNAPAARDSQSTSGTPAASPSTQQGSSPQQGAQPSGAAQRSGTSQQGSQPSGTAQQSGTSRPASQQAAGAAQLDEQQRARISETLSQRAGRSITNVNISVSPGAALPRNVRLQPLPRDIVSIVPQYRGYSYTVVEDRIVIVEPRTRKVVTVIERSGGRSGARAASAKKIELTREQRATILRAVSQRTTTGSRSGTQIRVSVGEQVPPTVELQSFPETIIQEVPVVREYRFFLNDGEVVLVDPAERRVVEIIRG
jgi:hypothetical protein